jgi:PTS system ascorbate-specific IIA component
MTGIVIVVHAPLGQALLDCASHIMGSINGVAVHDIGADEQPEVKTPEVVVDILQLGKTEGVLVLTDLVGATPANIAKRAVLEAQAQGVPCAILAGLNTPMLLRALTYRKLPLVETREKALAGGVQGVLRVD